MGPWKFYIRFILLLLLASDAFSQQFPFVHYTPRDGLVNNRARSLCQDSKGRIYIATYGGLSVYDGSHFMNYTTDNGLSTSLVNDIAEMGDDSLWIVPNGPMLHCLVHGQLKNIQTADHFYPTINQLLTTVDGSRYAIADDGLFRFEKDRFIKIPLFDPSGRDMGRYLVQAVAVDHFLVILTDQNLELFPGPGKLLVYDLAAKKLQAICNSSPGYQVILTPRKEVWLSTATGIWKVDLFSRTVPHSISLSPVPEKYRLPDKAIARYMYFDRRDNCWLSTTDGVYRIDPSGERKLFSEGLDADMTTCIFQDRENTMWFTNEQTGVSKLADAGIELLQQPAPHFTAGLIYSNPRSDSSWLYDPKKNQILLLTKDKQQRFDGISAIASNPSGIILGQRSYLVALHHIYELQFLPGHRFRAALLFTDTLSSLGSIIQDKKGNLVAISDKKITAVLPGKIVQLPFSHFSDQPVIDSQDRLWISTRSNQLLVYSVHASDTGYSLQPIREINTATLPPVSPRCLAVDSSGHIWMGTRDHGLFRLQIDNYRLAGWEQFTKKDGLAENFVTSLHCDADNTIWVCTAAGLDKVKYDHDHLVIRNMTSGFAGYQYIFGIQSNSQGIHWALTKTGIIKISDPAPGDRSPAPGIIFSKIIAANDSLVPSGPLSLSYRKNSIHFYISSPSFLNELQTRYQYWLEGDKNTAWSMPSTQSEINFENLSPGKYQLHVKARFPSGSYPEQTATIGLIIRPPWWQTWWCRVLAALITIAIGIVMAKIYTRRKLDRQRLILEGRQAVERERTRIATDMHDDLGSGLTRIKFITENIAESTKDHQVRPDIEKLQISSNELVEKMGEIIWAMNEKNNTLEDLIFYLRAYTVDYCDENNLACDFVLPSAIPDRLVSGQVRRNVFLVLKECLHNIVKHAAARQVEIKIRAQRNLVLLVRDDGKGFDDARAPHGNGLLNMQHRAKTLGGQLIVRDDNGISVQLEIPLPSP